MFRIVSGYFLQINSVIIRLVWLTSLSGIKVNIIQIWIRFFQIESGGLIKFIYRPVKHKYINVSFHRCCIILTRGSNCKSIIQATDLLEERAEDTYNHCLLQNIHRCTTKWLRQPVFNCEWSLLLVTAFKLFNHLEVSTLSPTCLYMIDQFKYFKFIIYVWQYRGTQREILRKRPENNNRTWIKLSEAILGDFWEKFICSSLLARLVEEFPASKVHLRPATWLNGKFPSRRMSRHYWLVWVWS